MAYLTYFDVVEHLIASSFGGPQDAEQRDIRTAVHRCYAEIGNIRDWSWQHAHGRIFTAAPATATVSSLSGTTLQLSSGVAQGYSHVRIGDRVAEVVSISTIGGTTITLSSSVNFPSGTVVNGDTATFYKTLYDLPTDFRNLDEPSDEFNWWSGAYVTPDEAMKMERVNFQTGTPLHWTVIKSPNSSKYVLKLVGYPTSVETIDFTYRREPRPLRWSGHEPAARAGTVSTLGGAFLDVTGVSTEFSSSMVGAILRIGDSTNTPNTLTSFTPYEEEITIASVSSPTAMKYTGNESNTSNVKYLITDPIDLPEHMHNVMLSGSEYWLARIRSSNVEEKYQLYQRDLRLAMEADQLAPLSGRSKRIWNDGGWRSPLLADNFDFSN